MTTKLKKAWFLFPFLSSFMIGALFFDLLPGKNFFKKTSAVDIAKQELQSEKSDNENLNISEMCKSEVSGSFAKEISGDGGYREALKKLFESNLQASEMVPYAMKIVRHLRRNLLEICQNENKVPSCIAPDSSSEAGLGLKYCEGAAKKFVDIAILDVETLLLAEIEEKDIDFLTEKFVVLHKNIKELNKYFYLYLAKFNDFNKRFGCYLGQCM